MKYSELSLTLTCHHKLSAAAIKDLNNFVHSNMNNTERIKSQDILAPFNFFSFYETVR